MRYLGKKNYGTQFVYLYKIKINLLLAADQDGVSPTGPGVNCQLVLTSPRYSKDQNTVYKHSTIMPTPKINSQ